jgi:hypothetical protein
MNINVKNIARFEAEVSGWISHFHIASDMPLELAEQTLVHFMQAIGQWKAQVQAQMDAQTNAHAHESPSEKVEQITKPVEPTAV